MKPITDYTDRELLELAAVYCGKKTKAIVEDQNDQFIGLYVSGHRGLWNPLTDAGYRARMCDELQLDMLHCESTGEITVSSSKPTKWHRERYSDHNGNRTTAANYAAVRLVAMMQLAKQEDMK